ncbi:MAG: YggS family pyridoxal phosphate-dependent enzyme [Anaerolineae bacterium]
MEVSVSHSQDIAERVAATLARVSDACAAAGRSPSEVTVVAASKTRTAAEVVAALQAGIADFGENRPEEAQDKVAAVAAEVSARGLPTPTWHMIGHIQSRKARMVVGPYSLVHSLDSLRLARRLSRLAEEQESTLNCLIEINVGGEDSKYGYPAPDEDGTPPADLLRDLPELLGLPHIRIRGLMTMAPVVEQPEQARPYFRQLRLLRDRLQEQYPDDDWSQLSMGMTNDFEAAILEGATLVRIGRAIFGPRQP